MIKTIFGVLLLGLLTCVSAQAQPWGGMMVPNVASVTCPGTSNFLTDNFSDTSGTLLSTHTPNLGGTWTKQSGSGDIVINGTGASAGAAPNTVSLDAFYTNSASPPCANYYVQATVDQSDSNFDTALLCRWQNSSNYYFAFFIGANVGGPSWQIYKRVAGSNTAIGTLHTTTTTTANVAKFTCSGTSITLLVTAESINETVTDNSISGAGVAGIYMGRGSGSGNGTFVTLFSAR